MTFQEAVTQLAKKLIDEKKIPLVDLINEHFSIPADRIVKFIKMLKMDLQSKNQGGVMNQVEQLYL